MVAELGELGYTFGMGQRTVKGTEGEMISIKDHYVSIWREQPDGTWKCIIET